MKILLGVLGAAMIAILARKRRNPNNDYFQDLSTSERVAGHPIVGVS